MKPLDLYKILPQKNCGKCPSGSCMSFAVQYLRRMAPLDDCCELDETARDKIRNFLTDSGDWKERRVKGLFKEISGLDLKSIAGCIGSKYEDGWLSIKYMGYDVCLNKDAFNTDIDIMDQLILLMYVKRNGRGPLAGRWVAFSDLKDGMIRANDFHGACEIPLAMLFDQRKNEVINNLISMGAIKVDGYSTEYSYRFNVLPKIPFLILLWPADEEFDASCKILLDSGVTGFLDVEALLYLGMSFVRHLAQA